MGIAGVIKNGGISEYGYAPIFRKRFIVGILTTRATVLNSVALVCSFCNYLEALVTMATNLPKSFGLYHPCALGFRLTNIRKRSTVST